jgi:CRP-like cAMP-binding protein
MMSTSSLLQRPVAAPDELRHERFRAAVAQSRLCRGLPLPAVDDLLRRMQLRIRLAGAVVLAEDEPGEAMFLIVDGRARVTLLGESGRELTLALLGRGDLIGEMALLDGRTRSANVVAIDDITLLGLSRDGLLDHLRSHPQTALNLLGELSLRLRQADQTIADLALRDVHERLVRTLERLARADGEEQPEGWLLRRRPTQQDLANMVGSCRETVSRAFTAMIRKGLMVPRGRAVLLTRQLLATSHPRAGQ